MQDIKQQLQRILETSDWSQEDRHWMLQYIEQNDTSELRQLMQKDFALNTGIDEKLHDDRAKQLLDIIHKKITATGKVVRISFWKRIAAAAAILIALLSGAYFIINNKKETETAKTEKPAPGSNDVAPGGNKAVLTLSDNSIIVLSDAQNGTLTEQGSTKITKLDDGRLAYNATGNGAEILYNTVSTPRGGQYQLTLSDGTQVWLNAASSLKFPAAFTGKERKVEITGEAYFEVAKDATRPFKVNVAGKGEVEVLGTHFNINSYTDEATINTTLLEGQVKVSAIGSQLTAHSSQLLAPGQQAQFSSDGKISINNNPDIEEVMAWKNGKFYFGDAMNIESVMRQVSRWYDVDIEYQGKVNGSIGGSISRNVNVSQVLEMLEMTGTMKFKINGKKVIVMAQGK